MAAAVHHPRGLAVRFLRLLMVTLLLLGGVPLASPPPAEAASRLPVASQTLAVAANYTLEVRSDGTLWAWGNAGASLGLGFGVNTALAPTQVGEDTDWVFVEADGGNSFAIKADGTLWAWGSNNNHALGLGDTDVRLEPTQVNSDTDWIAVACSGGNGSTFALKADGSLWAWGYNDRGELGLGASSLNVQTPVRVGDANDWVYLAASHIQAAAIKADGTLWAWGQNHHGNLGLGYTSLVVTTPTRVTGGDWVAVSTGIWHTAGIKADGSLWAWGQNDSDFLGVGVGQPSNVTSPMRVGDANDWVDVSTGFSATLGTRADGSAWGWGYNQFGQLGIGTTDNATAPTRIGVANDWVRVASSTGTGNRAFGMKADRSLYGWGSNYSSNRLGVDSTAEEVVEPMLVGSAHGWTDVAEGLYHTLAVRSDGTLWAAGHNQYGRLGLGIENQGTSVPVYTKVGTDTDWVAVAASRNHSVALKDDGTLWAWGSNERGELGIGSLGAGEHSTVPVQVGSQTDWAQIAAAADASYAVKDDGTLWCWGRNAYGQLGLDSWDSEITSPHMVESDVAWVAVDADTSYAMGVKADGTLWGWGHYSNGRLGIEGLSDYPRAPMQVGEDDKWVALSVGLEHSLALKADGTLWGWGANDSGELGLGNGSPQTLWTPTPLTAEGWSVDRWVEVSAGVHSSHAIAEDGTLWAWGENLYYRLGDGTTDRRWEPVQIGGAAEWVALGSHERTSRGIRADGSIWAWGQDDFAYGVFGDGSTGQAYPLPQMVAGGANRAGRGPIAVSAGREHTLALKSDGTLWAWGRNSEGQLGLGDLEHRDRPEQMGTDDDWIAVTAAHYSSYALKADGTLWAWGLNATGNLGVGDVINRDVPARVLDGVDQWTAIAAGDNFVIGLKADGSMWSWGANNRGQLGLGVTGGDHRMEPRRVGDRNDWARVTCSPAHSFALRADGTLWGWGANENAALGLGFDDPVSVPTPSQVTSAQDWIDVAASTSHSVAVKSDGTLWAWGRNAEGQTGLGSAPPHLYDVPTQVTGTGWASVSAGSDYSLALKQDGSLWAWGEGANGRLGLGDEVKRTTPVRVGADNGWVSISAYGPTSSALRADGVVHSWGRNNFGQLGLGDTEQRYSPEPVFVLGDTVAPVILAVRSESHPVAGVEYATTSFVADVSAVDSGSGVAGYSWVVDQSPDAVPDEAVDTWGADAVILAEDLEPGTWYLHVRVVDAGGNAGPVKTRQIKVSAAPVIYALTYSAGVGGTISGEATQMVPEGASGTAATAVPVAGYRFVQWSDGRTDNPRIDTDVRTDVTVLAEFEVLPDPDPDLKPLPSIIKGNDRYLTAIAGSKAAYPDGADAVVLATGEHFADALGGAGLAGALDSPLLLVQQNALPGTVAAEIRNLGATEAYILGGTSAVSNAVADAVKANLVGAKKLTRIAGANRYQTADRVAAETIRVLNASGGYSGDAFIATGANFPDALGASPVAAAKGMPVFLADPARTTVPLPSSVTSVWITGGTAVVSPAVETSLKASGRTVTRFAGRDRFDTAAQVARFGVGRGMSWEGVGITTGMNFPDALAAGPVLGSRDAVMLLTDTNAVPQHTRTALTTNKAQISRVTFFGGDAAVPPGVRTAVMGYAGVR